MEGEKQSSSMQVASEAALAALHQGGFDPEHAAEITRNALWTGLPAGHERAGFHPELTEAEIAEKQRTNRCGWPCCRPTASRAWSKRPGRCQLRPEFHYRFGTDLFIAGVRAMAPQP